MAKSSKKSFKESVADYAALSERIGRRQFAPVYLLMGEEPYFIDMLAERLARGAGLRPDGRLRQGYRSRGDRQFLPSDADDGGFSGGDRPRSADVAPDRPVVAVYVGALPDYDPRAVS